MMDAGNDTQSEHEQPESNQAGPARELTLHLLRMLETRADAAGIAVQSEIESFSKRLQLRVVAGAAIFLAVWAGIVLLAIVLPPELRVPVLASVVGLFVIGAVIALLAANRKVVSGEVGSMAWFLDGLKRDFEVFSRALEKPHVLAPQATPEQGSQNDLAA
jgi:uncharacterized membrane protein YqjE